MAYFLLQKGFELCGWKGLPFGLRYPNPHYTDFFDKESYRVVYALDGKHDIHEEELTEKQKELLQHLINVGIAVPDDGSGRLEAWQEYKSFPAMYKNHVQWSITGRCNYNCRHCFMSAHDYHGEDLPLDTIRHIAEEIAACGIRSVSLTGGEPLIHPHFYEILDALRANDLRLDTIYSNGALVDDSLLEELEKRNMHPAFHISFDGAHWHDWLRGIDGAEDTAVRAFRLLHERGYQTSTSMCLHKHNIGFLKESIDLLASLGLSHIKMNVASPTGRWKNEQEHFLTADEAYQAIIDYLPTYVSDGMPVSAQFCGFIDFNKETRRILIPCRKYSGEEGSEKSYACGAVRESVYISPQGRILPCMTLGGTAIDPLFDSVLEKPLSEILTESYYHKICLLKMGECIEHNEKCRDCKYRLTCGAGCRAIACGETSTDYLGIDEEACHFFQNGWYEKAQELVRKYQDSFPDNNQPSPSTNHNEREREI